MLKKILFLIVVLITNIIQGITGFAGTVLAMPVSVMLVGFECAKPILNVLGILAGLYVVATSYKYINKKEFLKIVAVMVIGILVGVYIKSFFSGNAEVLYKVLGSVVIATALWGVYRTFIKKNADEKPLNSVASYTLLISAGIVHGMFVCGGPLLVTYLAGRLRDKNEFRATISAAWVVLNTVVMFDDIRSGFFNIKLIELLAISAVALFAGMFIGNMLYKKMSKEVFMKITYVLIIVSGASLLVK